MTHKIADSPILPKPTGLVSVQAISLFLRILVRTVQTLFGSLSYNLNRSLALDGTDSMTGPLVVKTYTVATLPTASAWTGGIIYVSDETGGGDLAFSDGVHWHRAEDRAIVS